MWKWVPHLDTRGTFLFYHKQFDSEFILQLRNTCLKSRRLFKWFCVYVIVLDSKLWRKKFWWNRFPATKDLKTCDKWKTPFDYTHFFPQKWGLFPRRSCYYTSMLLHWLFTSSLKKIRWKWFFYPLSICYGTKFR